MVVLENAGDSVPVPGVESAYRWGEMGISALDVFVLMEETVPAVSTEQLETFLENPIRARGREVNALLLVVLVLVVVVVLGVEEAEREEEEVGCNPIAEVETDRDIKIDPPSLAPATVFR